MRIDLHTHTTASDGLLAPRALLDRAFAAGLAVIGITDHDTAAGVREALAAGGARPPGLEVVPGIEISSSVGDSELHVLGYFVDPHAPAMRAFEEERRGLRIERLRRIVRQLQAVGMDVTEDEVYAQPGGDGAPGRPHVARVLVRKGYAASMSDVFGRILSKDGPGHVPVEKPCARDAAALIERCGGVPVVAHPALDGVDRHLDELVASGVRGIEVDHPDHTPEARERFATYAEERGLLMTGGSDFHGDGRKDGGTLGGTTCRPEWLEALRRRAAGR